MEILAGHTVTDLTAYVAALVGRGPRRVVVLPCVNAGRRRTEATAAIVRLDNRLNRYVDNQALNRAWSSTFDPDLELGEHDRFIVIWPIEVFVEMLAKTAAGRVVGVTARTAPEGGGKATAIPPSLKRFANS